MNGEVSSAQGWWPGVQSVCLRARAAHFAPIVCNRWLAGDGLSPWALSRLNWPGWPSGIRNNKGAPEDPKETPYTGTQTTLSFLRVCVYIYIYIYIHTYIMTDTDKAAVSNDLPILLSFIYQQIYYSKMNKN